MPYNYEIMQVFVGEAEEMSKLEKRLQKINKDNKYKPNMIFIGANECFSSYEAIEKAYENETETETEYFNEQE